MAAIEVLKEKDYMLVLSSRSYVTAAFDLLFPALLEYVFNSISRVDDWWKIYVCDNKVDVLSKENRKKVRENKVPERWEDLYDYFDEYFILKLVTEIPDVSWLFGNEIQHLRKLYKIRNEWAHRGGGQKRKNSSEVNEKEWAEKAYKEMIESAEMLKRYVNAADSYPDIVNQLQALRSKMEFDWITKNVKLRPHYELIKYLDENVMNRVCKPSSPVDAKIRNRVLNSQKKLHSKKTSEEVIDFFWDAIKVKTEVYDEIKKHDLPTFEDICAEFAKFALQEEKAVS